MLNQKLPDMPETMLNDYNPSKKNRSREDAVIGIIKELFLMKKE